MDSKLKENHFALEGADKEEIALKNGHAEASSCRLIAPDEIRGDSAEIKEKTSFMTELDHASGDKACIKDKADAKSTTASENESCDSKTEPSEEGTSELNDTVFHDTKGSLNSTGTDCTQCSAETTKLVTDDREPEPEPEVTKQSIRTKVWDHLDKNDLVVFPRPCQGRIPNFKGAPAAAEKLIALDVFRNSKTIKVNPDKPQEMVRFHTLEVSLIIILGVGEIDFYRSEENTFFR